MTIEEAIERYTSNAEYERTHGNLQGCLEFRQLAEWLKDYKRLKEQEQCDDAVSRQAVLEAIDVKAWEFCDYLIRNGRNDEQKPVSHFADNLRECVGEDLPSVSPQPKMERWIEHINNGMHYIECPKCSSWFLRMYLTRNSYCPNCGAKMQEVEE